MFSFSFVRCFSPLLNCFGLTKIITILLQNKEIFKKKLTFFGFVLITLSFVNEKLFNIASMKTDILRQNISEKVQEALKEQGRQKKWLYKQLGMSAPTLDSRLETNAWSVGELIKLQDLLGIK